MGSTRSSSARGACRRNSAVCTSHCSLAGRLFEVLHLIRGIGRDRHSIPVQQPIAGERGQPRPGRDDADQIQRIGGRQRYESAACAVCGARRAAGRRPPASHIARRRNRRRSGRREFRPAPPGGGNTSVSRATAAANSPRAPAASRKSRPSGAAASRTTCSTASSLARSERGRRGPPHQRPASRIRHAEQGQSALAARAVGAGILECVPRRPLGSSSTRRPAKLSEFTMPERHEFGQRILHFHRQHAGVLRDFVEERSAVLAQEIRHHLGSRDVRCAGSDWSVSAAHSGTLRLASKVMGVERTGDAPRPRSGSCHLRRGRCARAEPRSR